MRYIYFSIAFFISFSALAQETTTYPKYTLGEVYELIFKEKSDTFTLKNANIILDTIADKNYLLRVDDLETFKPVRTDSIEIHKSIVLENVFMQETRGDDPYVIAFNKVIFHNSVSIKNSSLWLTHSHFKSTVDVRYDDDATKSLNENFGADSYGILELDNNIFEFDPRIIAHSLRDEPLNIVLFLRSSTLKGTNEIRDILWLLAHFTFVRIEDNAFINRHANYISIFGNRGRIVNNDFGNRSIQVRLGNEGVKSLEFTENEFDDTFMLTLPESVENLQMDWSQFSSGIIGMSHYGDFIQTLSKASTADNYDITFRKKENIDKYLDSARVVNNRFYRSEIALLGTLNSIYKRQHDIESANGSFIALKDLQTQRLEYCYNENPSFDSYFEWKVNQFLKLFSDYGTRPSKAIVFAVYVIAFFAAIYLFFPNHWDSHGKNRILHRFGFFLKYVDRKAGMHEVYMEDKKEELLVYEDFKKLLHEKGQRVPGFFLTAGLPLYKWAVSGSRFSSWFLSRVDVLKGTWEETPKPKRWLKYILVLGAFIIALIYDLFIKVLNAVMLSINTFTTLGFGEIPIKGLPRYLAIIQGFIGWFMLTIFSVSLISQLLN